MFRYYENGETQVFITSPQSSLGIGGHGSENQILQTPRLYSSVSPLIAGLSELQTSRSTPPHHLAANIDPSLITIQPFSTQVMQKPGGFGRSSEDGGIVYDSQMGAFIDTSVFAQSPVSACVDSALHPAIRLKMPLPPMAATMARLSKGSLQNHLMVGASMSTGIVYFLHSIMCYPIKM